MCHFHPLPSKTPDCPIIDEKKFENVKNALRESLIDWCRDHQNIQVCQALVNLFDEIQVILKFTPLSVLKGYFKIIIDRLDRNIAVKDDDQDGFSNIGTLRGYWWKGTDLGRISIKQKPQSKTI